MLCGAVSAANTKVSVANVQVPFIENQGQTDSSVEYYADTYYGTAYVTEDGITHAVTLDNTTSVALQEQFLDENGQTVVTDPQGEEQSPTNVNYFIGNDESQWQTNLNTYNQVNLGELYPGITVKVWVNGANVEKLFYIQPGRNVNNILVQILGTNSLEILEDGTLAIQTGAGVINMAAPKAYQGNHAVDVTYLLPGDNTYGFAVGNYDHSKELIIDPTLEYSTYLGGNGYDMGSGITVDNNGNTYIAGYADSTGFPVTAGAYQSNAGNGDVFVSKLNPDGTGLVYSTYFGGTGCDYGNCIVVDGSGYAYIIGSTDSTDFPVTAGTFQTSNAGGIDNFVSKLNPTGNGLVYSTYIGGSSDDYEYGLAVNSAGNAYISGWTISGNYPTTTGAYQTTYGGGDGDAFVSKLNSDGTGLVYSTYFGGSSVDLGYGIAVDSAGCAYITGDTMSGGFVTSDAYQTSLNMDDQGHYYNDAFVSKLNPDGTGLIYSTYFGGSSNDYGTGIAVDSAGNFYIIGQTNFGNYSNGNFPTTTGAYQTTYGGGDSDIFAAKFNSNGSLAYSTILGGNSNDFIIYYDNIDVSNTGKIYITGYTQSTNYPVTSDAYQTTYGDSYNAFLSIINPSGNGSNDLFYSTYFGGSSSDEGWGIVVDSVENAYITGYTTSTDFPVTTGAFQQYLADQEMLLLPSSVLNLVLLYR